MGSIDGLNLEVRNSFVYREGTIGEGGNMNFQWGSTEVRGSIPLNKRLSMILESGGGDNGWVYGEVGIKTYFSGNGGRGTVIVPIGIGVGGFQEVPAAIGPLLSFGVEYRD